MSGVDYFNTFIAVAPDSTATGGMVPHGGAKSGTVVSRMWHMITQSPYKYTSADVIFSVHADRAKIAAADRPHAREEYFSVGRACLRSSDLGKRYGWGIHADTTGHVALYAVGTREYAAFAAGVAPNGEPVALTRAMRSIRR
ncbi:DUF6157 family protein [Cryobacterium psychrophilum]|uniref:Uncharacterized protein n=1 Tax=Cryobacterium psychrophilum TaxID=41988 RepID=A0A4Y8KSZ7_9MICO|nr:DUF6157 family protein [Cryobacterium psychrophilum]TDW29764.1 hypothetical protein EDD25_1474 [Cryobacterium psychrophilum]TFD81864.1 hypothetical protein E3T53_02435 [Cryobacterium psychrophilum]